VTDARRVTLATAIAIGIVAAGVVVFAWNHWNTIYDDAFIYFRYVDNLRHGCGMRFNCDGVAVEGFTGPLYLAVLWAGSLVTDQLVQLCQYIGCACAIAAGVLGLIVARQLGGTPKVQGALAVAAGIALGLDPYFQLNAVIGMETAMAAAVVTVVGFAAVTQRPRLLVGAACAAWLVRPECALLIAALPILPWMRKPRLLLIAALVVVSITALRYAMFDSFVPNTYVAKSGGTMRHAELGLHYIADAFVDFPLAFLAPLALFGAHRRLATFVLVPAALWLLFFLRSGGDLFDYSRLFVPLVPTLTALALAGIAELADRVAKLRAYAFVAPVIVGTLAGGRAAIAHALPAQGTSQRVLKYIAIGRYLHDHFPGKTIATVPIGAIGYYSQLPIIDLVGLADPTIAREGRTVPPELLTKDWIGHERHYTEYVLAQAPDVIVTTSERDHAWTAIAEGRAGFWADAQLVHAIKAGDAPYHVHDAEVAPGHHILMFVRD